jgi:hypothetical protein
VVIFAIAWHARFVWRWLPAGATGNDPSTYLLIARDLSATGTPVHPFVLFQQTFDLQLSWYAFILPGYRFVESTAQTVPVFSFGFPLLLAAAQLAFGAAAAFWVVPVLGGLVMLLVFLIGLRLFAGLGEPTRYLTSALAALLLASTPKQIAHALVPMSDVPAQCFVALAVWLALRDRGQAQWLGVGVALGMAYLVRHSAMVALLPIGFVAWHSPRRWRNLAALLSALAVLITPDLWYRAQNLESVLAAESPEAQIVGAQFVWPSLRFMGHGLFSWRGFGPLVLFGVLGSMGLWRAQRRAFWVLLLWVLGFIGLHAPLMLTTQHENELRYLLPAYPALVLGMAAGVGMVMRWVYPQRNSKAHTFFGFRFTCVTAWAKMLSAVCTVASLVYALRALPTSQHYVAQAYGHLAAQPRHDLEALHRTLPANSVIGSSQQLAGAIQLYAQRDVFLPERMLQPAVEFPKFLQRMRELGRPVFVLGNLNCGLDPLDSERLPVWLQGFAPRQTNYEIRGLPYKCPHVLMAIRD